MIKRSIDKIKISERESKYLEFKEKFDPTSLESWCEIIKDIIALTNSGGGVIVFGLKNNGSPSKENIDSLLQIDPAQITDKIEVYTGEHFSDFEIQENEKDGDKIAILYIGETPFPIVFNKPGTYPIGEGKQKNAFSKGTIYFRHGTKSEPGNSKDIRDFLDRELNNIKKSWLGGIRKIIRAPRGHEIKILPSKIFVSEDKSAIPIRIVNDANAPPYQKIDPNRTHPYRQKEIVTLLNSKLKNKKVTSYDILCVRRIYSIDTNKPEFFYRPKFGSPQYSEEFIEWLHKKYEKDQNFFNDVRVKYGQSPMQ